MPNLFRPEVVEHKTQRLTGQIFIAVPVSWTAISGLIVSGLILASIYMIFASYPRVEVIVGAIYPDKGVATVMPTRTGIVTMVHVSEGDTVEAGAKLVDIRAEEDTTTGPTVADQIEAAVERQESSLASQINAVEAGARAQVNQIQIQRLGLRSEIEQLQSQIVIQRSLVRSAQDDYDRALTVSERGFISQRDLSIREETLLARRQGLSQLNQTLAAKNSSLAELARTEAQISEQAKAQTAGLSVTRAEIARDTATTSGARAYLLRASIAGEVTAVTARVGQSINSQTPVMSIVPRGSTLMAELRVPTAAIGFLEPGQDVRISVDAFPYQRFGTIRGEVMTVATSPIISRDSPAGPSAIYPVRVKLDQDFIVAFGRNAKLLPGMTLTARIITEERTLLEWLFEPIFAVSGR